MTGTREAAGHHPDGSHDAPRHLTGDLPYPTRWKPPTQAERVRALLAEGWTCATEFLELYIPRYGARIHELRQQGVVVERRACENEDHLHFSTQYEWRIAPEGQGRLFAPGA